MSLSGQGDQGGPAERPVSRPVTSKRHSCSGCPSVWTANTAAHCSRCHQTFAGVSLFDAHRAQFGERGACEDPEVVGLVFRDRMWRRPEMTEEEKINRFGRAA